ncbi:MAG: tyrosine-type recombinase/integrase, partial [Alphaproteobacteria bacterium]|nr:tyrosine-type recombinase/integrase [Alphaproteobacteria bacterium]
SWVYRFMLNGTAQWMGLGPLHDVPLADARVAASEKRELRRAGVNPIKARNDALDASRLDAARSITFKDAAERYMAAHKAGWRNAKHADQWRSTLETYAYPVLGSLPVQGVDVALVMKVLEPIWATKTETASRVRQRIESILDWASARGYRLGENPARWRGHIDKLLPSRSKVQKVEHYPALPYDEVGAFMAGLRMQQGTAASALEFLILTACRTGEGIGAQWGEFNIEESLWTVPAERVKSGRQHRVPLSPPALKVIQAMQKVRATESDDGFVFPGGKRGRPLSNMALLALLKRMGRSDLTVHGFRSTFRDWAAERTNYPREAAEMALGHIVSDKVEAAYRRGDLFQKRRRLMDEWARFCHSGAKAGKIVAIRGK